MVNIATEGGWGDERGAQLFWLPVASEHSNKKSGDVRGGGFLVQLSCNYVSFNLGTLPASKMSDNFCLWAVNSSPSWLRGVAVSSRVFLGDEPTFGNAKVWF